MLEYLIKNLSAINFDFELCNGVLPKSTVMHNLDHEMPFLVVWPTSTEQLQEAFKLINPICKDQNIPVSVVSGGHGYDGKAMCAGITIDMQKMNACYIENNNLFVQPGCGLRKIIDTLQKHSRIIPHGDSLTVGAGGHFISAGWDLLLTRKYGLGCQHIKSAVMVYWDGSSEFVTESSNPSLFHAIKGSFGNRVGIVTELKLETFEAPEEVHLAELVLNTTVLPENIIELVYNLPPEISTTFRFYYQNGIPKIVLVIGTLLSKAQTINIIAKEVGADMAEIVNMSWVCESLSDVRFLPLKNKAREDWESIVNMTTEAFEQVSENYWKREVYLREMEVSYCQQRSYWIDIATPNFIFQELIEFLYAVEPKFQKRVYGNITIGGGEMWKNRANVSMPIGKAIIRFECHSDSDEIHHTLSKNIADKFTAISSTYLEGALIGAVYSGDEFKS